MFKWTGERIQSRKYEVENKVLKSQLELALNEIEELKVARDRVINRMRQVEVKIADIHKLAFASDYTRSDIDSMTNEEFLKCEAEIDKDLRERKTFLL